MILGPHGKLISDGKHSYCQGPFSSWVCSRYLPTYVASLRRQSDATDFVKRIDFWRDPQTIADFGGREDEKMEYPLRNYRIGTSAFIYFARAIVATRKNSSAKCTNREAPSRRSVYSEANARRSSFKSKLPTFCSFSFSCSLWNFASAMMQ